MKYTFERLGNENLQDLIPLYSKVFGKNADISFVTNKYNTEYLGSKYLGYIAYDDHHAPVAFNGAVPFRISYQERIYLGAQFGDAMTLPAHAGNGLFTKCGELSNELIKKENIPIIYGFPNQNSQYGYFHHLKWQKLHQMNRYEVRLKTIPVAEILKKVGIDAFKINAQNNLKKYHAEHILMNSVLADGHAGTLRDKEFYHYKSFLNNHIIDLNGCRAWIKIDNGLLVGDMERSDSRTFWKCVDALKEICVKLGHNKIIFQTSPDTYLDQQLALKLQPKISWTAGYLDFGADFDLKKLRFNYGDLDTF